MVLPQAIVVHVRRGREEGGGWAEGVGRGRRGWGGGQRKRAHTDREREREKEHMQGASRGRWV